MKTLINKGDDPHRPRQGPKETEVQPTLRKKKSKKHKNMAWSHEHLVEPIMTE